MDYSQNARIKTMKRPIAIAMISLSLGWLTGTSTGTLAQDAPPAKDVSPTAASAPAQGDSTRPDPKVRRAHLEREFAEMLTGATLRGMWQMTGEGGLTGKEPLTEPKAEAYHIVSAAKLADDYWLISARIEVGEKNVTVPVPVRVEWAGDTPVITLDDIPIPTMGTYSARVMFHRGFYSGTWLSNVKNYGGIMAGRITKEAGGPKDEPSPPAPQPESKPADSKPTAP